MKNIDKKIQIYKCKYCDKKSNRRDIIDKHIKNCTASITYTHIEKNKNKNGNHIIATGDNNKIIIKQYNLIPFSKDGIDCLSINEKFEIFSSNENPMEMIIIKVNLNPQRLNHHNIGLPEKHSGYGIIFDGDQWLYERISVIMEILLNSKEQDLLKIYDEIKDFLKDDKHKYAKDALMDLSNTLRGKHIDTNAKKKLVAHLKKHFENNRNLIKEAMSHTKKNNITNKINKNKLEDILKDGLTIKDVEKSIQIKKRINLKKEMAINMLNELIENINKKEYKLLINIINQTDNIKDLSTITHLLGKSYCFGNKINNKIIQDKINESTINDKILFG